jgi:hypothetical protein
MTREGKIKKPSLLLVLRHVLFVLPRRNKKTPAVPAKALEV